MRYENIRKPRKCPKCGSTRIATILYGFPVHSIKLMDDIDSGKVALGGCCISDDDPVWECVDCETTIYKKGKKKSGET